MLSDPQDPDLGNLFEQDFDCAKATNCLTLDLTQSNTFDVLTSFNNFAHRSDDHRYETQILAISAMQFHVTTSTRAPARQRLVILPTGHSVDLKSAVGWYCLAP